MSANLIANRYAKALLSLAKNDHAKADQFSKFLEVSSELFHITEARKVLKSPVMPAAVKKDLLQFAGERAGAGPEVGQFITELLTAGRVGIIPEIHDSYRRLLDEERGIAHAKVTTADPLDAGTSGRLQETLSKVFNKKLTIDNKVDPKVLGGLVVEVGNFALDLSVKAKLDTLAEHAQH